MPGLLLIMTLYTRNIGDCSQWICTYVQRAKMANYWNINMVNDERRMIGRTATALEAWPWRPYWATPRVTWGSGGHGLYSMRASGWSGILQRGGESTVIPIYSTLVPINTHSIPYEPLVWWHWERTHHSYHTLQVIAAIVPEGLGFYHKGR